MHKLLIVLTAAALLAVGCGRGRGSSTTKKDKDSAKAPDTAATGGGATGARSTDGGAATGDGRTKAADPVAPSLPDAALADGDIGFLLARWETIRSKLGKENDRFKAGDLPLDAWAAAAPAKLPANLEEALGTQEARQFLKTYPRLVKVYRCTVGLEPGNDITRDERQRAEDQSNDPGATAEEKAEARKRAVELRKKAWDNAAGGIEGLKPTQVEFAAMQRNERRLIAMFKGVAEAVD